MNDRRRFVRVSGWTTGPLLAFALASGVAGTVRAQTLAGDLVIRRSRTTGLASFVTPAGGDAIAVKPKTRGAQVTPMDFLKQRGQLFGVTAPQEQLVVAGVHTDALGYTHTTYHQVHKGVPVFAGVLKVHQNANRRITAANGDFFPISDKLNVTPTIDAATARKRAAAALPDLSPNVERSELVIVDPGWYGDPPQGARLAYHIILTDRSAPLREAFFVGAHTGTILDRWSMIDRAKARSIHDTFAGSTCCYAHGQTGCDDSTCEAQVCTLYDPFCCDTEWDGWCAAIAGNYLCTDLCALPGPPARSEGDSPYGDAEVDAAYDYFGDTYDYFFRAFGRDGIDGAGMEMIATVNSYLPGCPNAYWNGSQMVFCPGLVTDDIVGHELTHGVTQHTANLIYQNQSGQLNESFSDVFGELIDLFNGDAAFAGAPGGDPWPTHPTGPGTDSPNNLRTMCSYGFDYLDGVRWLLGEDASQFGGAIRDMWDPTCFGHPDRAYSTYQTCDPQDAGGVHSGSGIPNHAFAILTDGKDFNGQSVTGIGPIKAAAVWYRALNEYLAVADDFEDAYAAFKQAADDLINAVPMDPRTGDPSDSMFTDQDAAEVDKALLAVEMNTEGACGATMPVLDSNPPSECTPRLVVYSADFEEGAPDWTVYHTPPRAGAHPYDWVLKGDLPFDRPGTAWFCDDPSFGDNCASIDESAVHSLYSPTITLPEQFDSPTLAFTHYMASEAGWDGGNVKLRVVDGGAWQLVPESAFSYNPYNTTLLAQADGNTNPLEGQAAWSGVGGRWGTTLVDLSAFVTGGETIQFKFDFGKDMCNGIDGWYIDDFAVYVCACVDDPVTVDDCNGNGIPDDCEPDCNGNGTADECDIASGASQDCTGNGIPDECESDCNNNGTVDSCDIADCAADDPLCADCNANGIPDECDIDGGASDDCDGDGVPDDCQPDCDGDGIPDVCKLPPFGASSDCNVDGIPDECQTDCNGNGLADECEIADATSTDCNSNGIPDECEVDSDGDNVIDSCDACPSDVNKIAAGICGCNVADTDSDNDGTANCNDGCPSDANKTAAGDCGCGKADTDSDSDGTADCDDGCPDDSQKSAPGKCGCGTADTDSDNDGTPDCTDECPDDPTETTAGVCGCGVSERDTDLDGTPDCNDGCPVNPAKTDPGVCGCLTPETDSDGDGTPDCRDSCPDDPAKTKPGECGCGATDGDADGDGTLDCRDHCPQDREKTEPGDCGCGIPDVDADRDGITDCVEDGTAAADSTARPRPARLSIVGPSRVTEAGGAYSAELSYDDGTIVDVTNLVRWETYSADFAFGDTVMTGAATISVGGVLRSRSGLSGDAQVFAAAFYETDAADLAGFQLVTAAASEPTAEQPTPDALIGSGLNTRFCGIGMIGPLFLSLSILAFVRVSRRGRVNRRT